LGRLVKKPRKLPTIEGMYYPKVDVIDSVSKDKKVGVDKSNFSFSSLS
jgi:hypothetical protein